MVLEEVWEMGIGQQLKTGMITAKMVDGQFGSVGKEIGCLGWDATSRPVFYKLHLNSTQQRGLWMAQSMPYMNHDMNEKTCLTAPWDQKV